MKFDLKKPCKNCPFANTPDRITFACRERAEEIEELAYRQGFVCHLHSEHIDEDDDYGGEGGFDFAADGSSQHCFGALAMHIRDGGSTVPWERACEDDEELEGRWWDRADQKALATVYESEDEFFDANTQAEAPEYDDV